MRVARLSKFRGVGAERPTTRRHGLPIRGMRD
jgi:hypothetical protein